MGVDGLVIWVTFDILLLVVVVGIPVMPIDSKQRLFEASVTVYLCKQHIAQYIVEILTTALGHPNHVGPKSKIVPPCSAQTR